MKLSKDSIKKLLINFTRFTFIQVRPNTLCLMNQFQSFSKKKETETKKNKNEKEKKEINREYEHVSTEEIKSKYKQLADVLIYLYRIR
jgi:hypothetical protein